MVHTLGTELTPQAVSVQLEVAQMAKLKWPERIELFQRPPMTPTRKVMRTTLAAQLLARES